MNGNVCIVLKRKLKLRGSINPLISTKRTITLQIVKYAIYRSWHRHRHEAGINRFMVFLALPLCVL
jgi:hypothetical protein